MPSVVRLLPLLRKGLPIDVTATAEKVDEEVGVVDDEAEADEVADDDDDDDVRTIEDEEIIILEEEEEEVEEEVAIAVGDNNEMDERDEVEGERRRTFPLLPLPVPLLPSLTFPTPPSKDCVPATPVIDDNDEDDEVVVECLFDPSNVVFVDDDVAANCCCCCCC